MATNSKTMTVAFTGLFDVQTSDALAHLAEDNHMSKAAVVRSLIRARFAMDYDKTPLCADGGACRCPHAHIYGPSRVGAPADPDRPL